LCSRRSTGRCQRPGINLIQKRLTVR
jgi:hypothetical protein